MNKTFLDVCVPMGDNGSNREIASNDPPALDKQLLEVATLPTEHTLIFACESASAPVVGSLEGGAV